jgi:aryl-alcohol dehydrogenase-like predicted oxidoreductase
VGSVPRETCFRRGPRIQTHPTAALQSADHEDGIRIIHSELDAGINFIDTADIYSQGESEIIVGKARRRRGNEVPAGF